MIAVLDAYRHVMLGHALCHVAFCVGYVVWLKPMSIGSMQQTFCLSFGAMGPSRFAMLSLTTGKLDRVVYSVTRGRGG